MRRNVGARELGVDAGRREDGKSGLRDVGNWLERESSVITILKSGKAAPTRVRPVSGWSKEWMTEEDNDFRTSLRLQSPPLILINTVSTISSLHPRNMPPFTPLLPRLPKVPPNPPNRLPVERPANTIFSSCHAPRNSSTVSKS